MVDTIWHDVETLNGIGPAIAAELNAVGIRDAEQLLGHPEMTMARSLADLDGLTVANIVGRYIPQVRLMRLEGLDAAQAAHLVERGHDYASMMLSDTEDLIATLDAAGLPASEADLMRARLGAAQRFGKGTLLVRVLDADRTPVAGAEVLVVDPPATGVAVAWTHRTNDHGFALIEMVRAGQSTVLAYANDRAAVLDMALTAEARSLELLLNRDAPDGLTHDEAVDGPVFGAIPASRPHVDFADLPDGTLLEFTGMHGDEPAAIVFFRKRIKLTWRHEIAHLPADAVPDGVEPGALLRKAGDGVAVTGTTATAARLTLMRGDPLDI